MTDKKFPGNTVFNTELFLKNGEIIDPDDVGVALNAAPHPVAMTEITQADRDAAAEHEPWEGFADEMRQGKHDSDKLVKAFARHRMEERAAIVAWLRRYGLSVDYHAAADEIEAGEHLK